MIYSCKLKACWQFYLLCFVFRINEQGRISIVAMSLARNTHCFRSSGRSRLRALLDCFNLDASHIHERKHESKFTLTMTGLTSGISLPTEKDNSISEKGVVPIKNCLQRCANRRTVTRVRRLQTRFLFLMEKRHIRDSTTWTPGMSCES